MVKKVYLIPDDGECLMEKSRSLGRSCESIGNAFRGGSRGNCDAPASRYYVIPAYLFLEETQLQDVKHLVNSSPSPASRLRKQRKTVSQT